MNYITEIIISGTLILYILIELIRINFLKKDNNDLVAGLASVLLLLFGMYLSLKYGIILDYSLGVEILESKAETMSLLAVSSLAISLFFILLSIIKFSIWKYRERFKAEE
ncbi:MAG TPA: hypothetical protein VFD77_02220 [Brumimicrobium sp.]|nr:hypothetical protein [Brumimicrobium sp.]